MGLDEFIRIRRISTKDGINVVVRLIEIVRGLLDSGHNLHFLTLAVKIVESQLGRVSPDGMDTTSQTLRDTLEFVPGCDLAFRTISIDVRCQRSSHIELVRVRVGRLSRSELLNLTRTKFKVLLQSCVNIMQVR